MAKKLSQKKKDKYDLVTSIDSEIKAGTLTKEEKAELKSYKIVKALKIKKYVRN